MAQHEKEKNIAGDSSEVTSLSKTEDISQTMGRNIGEFGRKMAGDFVEGLSKKFVSSKVDQIFNPREDPFKAGMRQRAYTSTAFPGVNPWELSGGSAGGGSGGQGGIRPAQIKARAGRQIADTTTAPRLSSVKLDYEKWPHQKEILGAETKGIQERTKEQEALNQSLGALSVATKQARTTTGIEEKQKGQVALYRGAAEEDAKQKMGIAQYRQHVNKGLQAISQSGIMASNAKIQKAYENVAKLVAENEGLGKLILGVMGLLAVTKGASAVLPRMFKGKGSKKK